MPNNKKQTKQDLTKQQHKEVIIIKMLIILAVLLVPLLIILINLSKSFSIKKAVDKDKIIINNTNEQAQDFNFVAPLPEDQEGNIANVSQEKIDSLFNNIKE